jgi:threonine dehydratase
MRAIPAHIVMPTSASSIKRDAVVAYGGKVIPCEPMDAARQETADNVARETGAVFIHPSNDLPIIYGQGTAALELLEETEDLDLVLAPVGGGGLLSGTALAVTGVSPGTAIIGVEPAGADDAYQSLQQGAIVPSLHPETIADGLLTSLGSNTFAIIQGHVREIVTVADESIVEAMLLVWERLKVVIEPSAAVGLAGLIEQKIEVEGRRVGIMLSGGNIDLKKLPW